MVSQGGAAEKCDTTAPVLLEKADRQQGAGARGCSMRIYFLRKALIFFASASV